ncbi:MAG: SelT/SelW/SelH family protein [Planctomycetales bacterium]|nr:SelT/SelW/SelH family protein [Planctomycetales bacterium]
MNEFKRQIEELTLVPSTGGVFELSLDDDLAYSKKATGKFPDEAWAVEAVRKRLGK